jgi:hypothetical protein
MLARMAGTTARKASATALALAVSLGPAAGLDGQSAMFMVLGETAGDDVALLLGDADFIFGIGALRPVVGVQGYLAREKTDAVSSIWTVAPSVGLRWAQPGGFLQGKIGYAWTDADGDVPFFGGGENGVITALHSEHWGDGVFGFQGIARHNWGSDYLWTRARVSARVIRTMAGGLDLGVEGGWQGHTGSPDVRYDATTVGPLILWLNTAVSASVGAGWKNVGGNATPGDTSTWYARVELAFWPW